MTHFPPIFLGSPERFQRSVGRCSHGAFTLMETLVAIGIMVILSVLLVPAYRMYIDRSQGAACISNMRQVGAALQLYRGENNGWFSPKGPIPPNQDSFNMNNALVPEYFAELPICPGARKRLTPAEKNAYGTEKAWFQKTGGTYALNKILAQWKLEAMPPPIPWWITYQASKTPFLLEIYFYGGLTWSLGPHQNATLTGHNEAFWGVPGRNHGGNRDVLNFMFVDGHIEPISQNDPRDVPAANKTFLYPTNPNGKFGSESGGLRFTQPTQFSTAQFAAIYGPQ